MSLDRRVKTKMSLFSGSIVYNCNTVILVSSVIAMKVAHSTVYFKTCHVSLSHQTVTGRDDIGKNVILLVLSESDFAVKSGKLCIEHHIKVRTIGKKM